MMVHVPRILPPTMMKRFSFAGIAIAAIAAAGSAGAADFPVHTTQRAALVSHGSELRSTA